MRIIIFANGVIDDARAEAARWLRPGDVLAAADGGTQHALEAGLSLNHVIGDLDSLPPAARARLESGGTRFHPHPPAKDETDLELALLWAAAQPGVEEVVVLGALGGRPDQALANLLLLALPALAGHPVLAADGPWTIRCIRATETLRLRGTPGDTLSLIPLGGPAEGVRTRGLAYPLHEETLHFGPARGVSNVFESTAVEVHLDSGMLWCFHKRSQTKNL